MVDQFGRWYPDYPGQQPFQDPAYMRAIGQPVQGQHPNLSPTQMSGTNQPAQDLTPTIRTEIKQVDSIEAISKCPPAPGTTGAYMTKDDKIIVFRSMYANGEYSDKIYDERPPAPPAPKFNPAEYVRRDEAEKFIKETIAAYIASTQQAKLAKEEK
jgi:hypothetical protein